MSFSQASDATYMYANWFSTFEIKLNKLVFGKKEQTSSCQHDWIVFIDSISKSIYSKHHQHNFITNIFHFRSAVVNLSKLFKES